MKSGDNMNIYTSFASVYDIFMGDTDYEMWVSYIETLLKKYNHNPNLVLDLGCGTGNVTSLLSKKGYDMIGIDISTEMLNIASEKAKQENLDILYIKQDMRSFELYGTVSLVISLFDCINYITDKDDLLKVFKLVNNYLDPGGLFIFDLNTEYKFKNILADNTFAETTEDAAYIWENYYDDETKTNEYYMNFFVKNINSDSYNRTEECHLEKAYSIDEIKELIEKSGLMLVDVFDAFTFNKPKKDSERLYFIVKEIQK